MQDEFLTVGEVARRADPPVSSETVRNWERAGLLRARRAAGIRLFQLRDVERFLERRRIARANAAA